MSRLMRDGTAEPVFRETKFSGTYGDRGIFIFPVKLTTSSIGKPYPVDLYSAICDDHTYIHTTYIL